MHPDTPLKWLKKFIDDHAGLPIPTVARMAGHSSPATTTKIYSHSIKTVEQLAIEKVANVINPSRNAK